MDNGTMRTRQSFDEELHQLEQRLLQFGSYVEGMLEQATRALVGQDLNLARQVVAADDRADEMDLEIEHTCMRLLALQQPMARDLRMIGTVMKIIVDVERIGDYSVDIAKAALSLADTAYFKPLVDLPRMSELVRGLLRCALEALVKRDLDLARECGEMDNAVDAMWKSLRAELEGIMQQHPEVVPQAVALILVTRYLERIADHAVNVAERVTYIETGHVETLVRRHSGDASEAT
ncbi:phosphate signaling complex protein PhoU [bacterium]|nr:phosphate signaling complex protein PhoU [bacterium]